jgi:hypothetical protein
MALFQLGAMNSSKTDLTKSTDKGTNILLRLLGPGLVTGAADDDPSGIATYSKAGAQFGYGLLWTVFLTTPFMIAIQLVSAQIGRVTGKGIIGQCEGLCSALANDGRPEVSTMMTHFFPEAFNCCKNG